MGGGRHRATTTTPTAPQSPKPHPLPPSFPRPNRHSCALPPSFLRRQEPRAHPPNPTPSSPIHPSPLSGGRLGGGWEPASMRSASLITAPSAAAPIRISPPFSTPSAIPALAITCRFRQQLFADSRSSDLETLTQVEFELVDVNDRIVVLHEPREILVPAAPLSDNDAVH